MNAATAAKTIETQAVKMMANFSSNYFLPLTGDLAGEALEIADKLYERLKKDNAGLSKHSVHALLEGSEKLIRGYEIVDVTNHHVMVAAAKRPDELSDKIKSWVGYQPAGPVKAVRKGTKIALGLEALKDGCTIEQLRDVLGHESNESTQAFLAYRPKKRGYGIRFDAETKEYFLVMQEGRDDIAYKTGPLTAAEKAEEAAETAA